MENLHRLRGLKSWSASSLNLAQRCSFAYYLKYELNIKEIPLPRMVLGKHIHKWAHLFCKRYKKKGGIPFKSEESFYNQVKGDWIRNYYVKPIEKVSWSSKEEIFTLAKTLLKDLCINYYDMYKEETPLFTEHKFDFIIEGIRLRGAIDEIRKPSNGKYFIRDIKTGSPKPTKEELENKMQFIIYALALGSLAHKHKEVREQIGISNKDAERWYGNPDYLNDKIIVEYLHLKSKETFPVSFTNLNYYNLLDAIEQTEKDQREGNFFPTNKEKNPKICKFCPYGTIHTISTENLVREEFEKRRVYERPNSKDLTLNLSAIPKFKEIVYPRNLSFRFPRKN